MIRFPHVCWSKDIQSTNCTDCKETKLSSNIRNQKLEPGKIKSLTVFSNVTYLRCLYQRLKTINQPAATMPRLEMDHIQMNRGTEIVLKTFLTIVLSWGTFPPEKRTNCYGDNFNEHNSYLPHKANCTDIDHNLWQVIINKSEVFLEFPEWSATNF